MDPRPKYIETKWANGHACTVAETSTGEFEPYIGVNAAGGNTNENPEFVLLSLVPTITKEQAWKSLGKAFIVLGLTDIKPALV